MKGVIRITLLLLAVVLAALSLKGGILPIPADIGLLISTVVLVGVLWGESIGGLLVLAAVLIAGFVFWSPQQAHQVGFVNYSFSFISGGFGAGLLVLANKR